MKTLLLFLAATSVYAECLPVRSDRIFGRDLAGIVPEFAKIPDEPIGFAPMPTVRRVMSGGELVRIGRKFGLTVGAPMDVCFETPTETLNAARVLEQIGTSLEMEGVEIELIEFSRYPVPVGELSFPKSGLNVHPLLTEKSIVFWRGKVAYAGNKSFAVWARVRMGISKERLVAAQSIESGSLVTEQQVRMAQVKQFPFELQPPLTSDRVIGRVARRAVPAGQVLVAASFASPKDVLRGAEVAVMVKTGGAQLSLPATAETSGAIGETVRLKNPMNGRTFQGIVKGKNQAMVIAK